jgi:NADH-quinone oxidoreductase subunit C/D
LKRDLLESKTVIEGLAERFGETSIQNQPTEDSFPTVWAERNSVRGMLRYLKHEIKQPFRTLYDLTAIDERVRTHRPGFPEYDFSVVYHLLSLERKADIRIKVALKEGDLKEPTITDLWPSADWYEREAWDMFGITFAGHPNLRRILSPPGWTGHALRKDHPSRATEMGRFELPDAKEQAEQDLLALRPGEFAARSEGGDRAPMFLNLGPHHPGTHGIFRIRLEMDGEEIVEAIPDIGYHHRGQEKIAERQTWHTYIPYTDRIDYLAGVLNEFPYVLAVEKLAGIEVPARARCIRVLLAELFRIASHLVWYGTFAQDLGSLSPVFYTFSDREVIFEIVAAITGFRMHPGWFRIGGVASDLPKGWERLVKRFIDYLPARLKEYDTIVMKNRIVKARTQGVGAVDRSTAIEWGWTGPNLRSCGEDWDLRKKRPYSDYDQFEFDVPTAERGDCYSRAVVRVEEMKQSLRIVKQCLENMPGGSYKADHPLTTPPPKERTMWDIDTLIPHFLGVSWGPVIPAGEASAAVESAKGNCTHYLISDGGISSYRTRIRTPSFAHLQSIPQLAKGVMVPDLIAILGSLDYVMGDCDR